PTEVASEVLADTGHAHISRTRMPKPPTLKLTNCARNIAMVRPVELPSSPAEVAGVHSGREKPQCGPVRCSAWFGPAALQALPCRGSKFDSRTVGRGSNTKL